ncbi:MAG TPA: ATP-binding protein [Candidatus Angelobacter sp.]|nr:ATP-binding protein [Candidatus Angelobacter sp.]
MAGLRKDRTDSSLPITQRRPMLVAMGVLVFVLFVLVFSQTAFNIKQLHPGSVEQTLLLVVLSTLVFLLLVALTFVLLRNLLKLYAERQLGVLGSRFRTRMVVAALLLSFAPAIVMFMFAYGLMNRSIDKWFSGPVEQIQQDSGYVAKILSNYAGDNARQEAAEIAASPDTQHSFETGNSAGVLHEIHRHQPTLEGGFAVAIADGSALASWNLPGPWGALRRELPQLSQVENEPQTWIKDNKEYVLATVPVHGSGRILVGLPLPKDFRPTLDQISKNQRSFLALSRETKRIRGMYMLVLMLLTVLVLFAATWVSLYVAKLVTKPVAALAEATREISLGHLGHRVDVSAADELGQLVSSFNTMAAELESSREKIEQSSRALADTNTELEQRRRHIETILENIPTGVLSLDAERHVSHSNQALSRMLWPNGGVPFPGSSLRDVFPLDVATDLANLLRKADRMSVTTSQLEIPVLRHKLNVAVTVSSVQHGRHRLGYVIVFEDFSDLLKAQKEAAWREVARRVAHEIKNPLTPIALSADRIRRHLDKGIKPDDASLAVIHGCAETIAGAVETVRSLVDEFSSLARFPAPHLRPANVNEIIENALGMFNGRLDGIQVETQLAHDLPQAMADPEAIKRALANLIDNAADAMQDSLLREIHISSSLVESKDAVEITVADTGHGVTQDLKEKLFLPYFSTKKRGTGLGLAIVRRIMEDHNGSIRVEENQPLGARFVMELPVAQAAVGN